MSLQVSDYLDQYVTICNERSIPVINSFKKSLENAVEVGAVPEVLFLHGTLPDLRQHRITDASMDTFLIPLAKAGSFVRELDLGCNELGDKGAQLLATFLKDDASLEGLRLNANDIGPQGATSLANALHFNDRLNFLDLSNNNIGDEGGMALANALQINTTLTQLSLVNTSLSGNSLIGLATVLRNNTSLITLDISNNRTQRSISNDVINHICKMLLVNYTLREIRLSKMGIDDWQCVEFVAPALKKNLRLYAADLSCNKITRDGSVAICQAIDNHPSLVSLSLSYCSIQDEGAEAVSQMLQNNFGLKELFLDFNSITGAGLIAIAQSFAKNFSLRKIKLWGNQWDVAACQAWEPFVGGCLVNVCIGDDLSGEIVVVGEPFPRDGRRAVSLRAESARAKETGTTDRLRDTSKRMPQRFKDGDIDVIFYSVEGVLNVAKRTCVPLSSY